MQPHAPITQRYQTNAEKIGYVEKLFYAGARHYDHTMGLGAVREYSTASFAQVKRDAIMDGLFSEYTATKPADAAPPR